MISRAVAGIAVAVAVVLLGCSGLLLGMLGGGDASANCLPAAAVSPTGSSASGSSGVSAAPGPIGKWNAEQVANAAVIVAVGRGMQVPARGQVIAVATAMQESSLTNLPGGDRDSVGLFQQRPSQGWGTPAQLQDPQYAATTFYTKLLAVPGWQTMTVAQAAQTVQISAYPQAYANWEPDAVLLVGATVTGGLPGCAVAGGRGWVRPVDAPLGSGFRTPARPGHDGVDLSAARGTPIRAVAAGTVTRIRCNATDVRTGADWGCNRDGHPMWTAGCGWYLDLTHPGQVITRYCHLLTHPHVTVGQQVIAGQIIGAVGSSGHSSGPHLHYEIHRGGTTAGTAIDPVPFMAAVGAPLH